MLNCPYISVYSVLFDSVRLPGRKILHLERSFYIWARNAAILVGRHEEAPAARSLGRTPWRAKPMMIEFVNLPKVHCCSRSRQGPSISFSHTLSLPTSCSLETAAPSGCISSTFQSHGSLIKQHQHYLARLCLKVLGSASRSRLFPICLHLLILQSHSNGCLGSSPRLFAFEDTDPHGRHES
jgi:hypothetical protein